MVDTLTLQNFRCFRHFSLEGIRPVTLIAGGNNAGKSTILESIFLFFDRYASNVFLKLNGFRGMHEINLSPRMIWEPLFSDMNVNNNINICISMNGELQSVIFSKDSTYSLSIMPKKPSPLSFQGLGMSMINSYPLKMDFIKNKENETFHFVITEAGIMITPVISVTSNIPYIYYMSSKANITPQEAAEWFGMVELAGNKTKCIEILNLLDNRICDLSVILIGKISGIFADFGINNKLSVNMLGDGVLKLLNIVLVMLANPGAIILIDEIENGFHYSFYPKLWEIIGKLSLETNCQVFATTHSYECISGANVLANNSAGLFRFVRIDQNNGKIISHVFENESFEYAIKNEWEIR